LPFLTSDRRLHHRQLPHQKQRRLGSWPRSKPTRTRVVAGCLYSQSQNPEWCRRHRVSLHHPRPTAGCQHISGEIRHRRPAVRMNRKRRQVTDLRGILPLANLSGSRSRKLMVPALAVVGRDVRVPCTNWSICGEGKKDAPSLPVGVADHLSDRSQSHKGRKNSAAQANFCSRLLVNRQSRVLLRPRRLSLLRYPLTLPPRSMIYPLLC
jgi:hypothetical protein